MLRNAELANYSNKLEINKSDHSKSWKVIREITGMNTTKPKHYSFSINDCIVADKQKIANKFNNFFVNIGLQLAAKCAIGDGESGSGSPSVGLILMPISIIQLWTML